MTGNGGRVSSDLRRRLYAHKFERCGKHVDDVAVLGANATFVSDFLRPYDDQPIASTAFAIGILLPEFEGRVRSLRPAQRIVPVRGVGCANFADLIQVISNRFFLRFGLAHEALIDDSVQRAFFAGAVVAEHNEYERIVELVDFL